MSVIKYYNHSKQPVNEEFVLNLMYKYRKFIATIHNTEITEDVHLLFRAYEKYSKFCDFKVQEW